MPARHERTHRTRAARLECGARSARTADASDNGWSPTARYGHNDREIVLGRKAWLFADTPAGAEASARLYSLIETAKANGLEPYTYLRRVLEELPVAIAANDDAAITQLLPWNVTATDA